MTPWLTDPDVTLYHGDCLEVLRELPAGSVHMCATSPPFYGLRNYGAEGQIGLEETPDEWVARLVAVFREVRRVLRDDGTLWVEIGDSYANVPSGNHSKQKDRPTQDGAFTVPSFEQRTERWIGKESVDKRNAPGVKQKDLLGQPWLLAFALRADGWWLRSEIIWARPNPMPESVTDRPTKSHSTVFLLSKQPRYFYDADAIREAQVSADNSANPSSRAGVSRDEYEPIRPGGELTRERIPMRNRIWNPSGANARSVWTIPTEPTPFAHFATWPQALVRRMILAGTSEKGCCPECGKPWVRNIEQGELVPTDERNRKTFQQPKYAGGGDGKAAGLDGSTFQSGFRRATTMLGWIPSCLCDTADAAENLDRAAKFEPVPCTVLDPFSGSGTTSLVARNHGRHSIGIELNQQYLEIAAKRLQQLSLLA